MYFSDKSISQLCASINIWALVKEEIINAGSQCIILQKNDLKWVYQCPFCGAQETMMFFNEHYYCHSCGRGGNAIDFIMRFRKFNFKEAVQYLAKKQKKEIPIEPEPNILPHKNEILYNINRDAARFYFDKLKSKSGEQGMSYFLNRGVTTTIRSNFGLGFAGEFGDELYSFLKNKGYSDNLLMDSGLIAKNNKNTDHPYYDKFWNRVMFPILDADSRVIGFGGRIMGDGKPKYLNSPETSIFNKGKNLYGYNIAQKSKLPYYICCEGYMDVMSLHQYGFDCAVASLGTALTRDQIKLLSNKKEVFLAYDSDEAGIRAAKRAISLCKEVGLSVRIINIVGAKDPDEFLKKFGTEEFKKLIQNAETDKHFLVRSSKKEGKFDFDSIVSELL